MAKFRQKIFQPGIKLPDMKYLTVDKPIEVMPSPETVYISMSQSIGLPAAPIVEEGQRVKKGEKIAEASAIVSAHIFASVAGVVTEIKEIVTPYNTVEKYIVIQNDFSEEEELLPPMENFEPQSIIQRAKDAGIVGLGGAGFPTAVKLAPPQKVNILVINGAECEPYLTCDNRLMLEQTEGIIKGIDYMAKALGVERVKIAIEENKPRAIELFKKNCGYEVVSLKKKYPQGSEKGLIRVCTGLTVPTGQIPCQVGVAVQNTSTAFALYEAVDKNKPLYERVVTITGKGVDNPKNLLVRNGTKNDDIINYCGGVNSSAVKIVRGGPMMGTAMYAVVGYMKKADSGVVVLTREETNTTEQTNCISCGRCATGCPMHLLPMCFDEFAQTGQYEKAREYGVMYCLECGCCSYVCPAKRSLVQGITLCKQKLYAKKGVKE